MSDAELNRSVSEWLHETTISIEEARAFGLEEALRLFNLGVVDDLCLATKLIAIGHLRGQTRRQVFNARLA